MRIREGDPLLKTLTGVEKLVIYIIKLFQRLR